MMLEFHCVDCGEKNILAGSHKVRCLPCWKAWREKGGITFTNAPVVVHTSGMKTGGEKIYANFAVFCRRCGSRLLPKHEKYPHSNSDILYALRCGGECHTCDACAIKRRWG